MKKKDAHNDLSRSHLETLTSSQLIDLADEYGIDIPEELTRQFIIAELVDIASEMDDSNNYKESITVTDDIQPKEVGLPETYNETFIDVVLRNPVSLYVFWDFNAALLKKFSHEKTQLHLKVCFFDDLSDENPNDFFDIPVDFNDKEQYILIPGGKKVVSVALVQFLGENVENLISSASKIAIPQFSDDYRTLKPGMEINTSPIMELSGLKTILKNHYNNYRQAFN